MSALSDLLATQPLSARDAAKKAEDRGIRLPAGTIAAYWSGRHGRPSPQTLERLAQVIDIPLAKLQEAAWGTSAPLGDYVPPAEAALLDERQRRAIDELIRSMVGERSAARHRVDVTMPLLDGGSVDIEFKTSRADSDFPEHMSRRLREWISLWESDPAAREFLKRGAVTDAIPLQQADYGLAARTGAGKSRGQQIRDEQDASSD